MINSLLKNCYLITAITISSLVMYTIILGNEQNFSAQKENRENQIHPRKVNFNWHKLA
jgi:hypothetical protein